jgi:hypothetical protein
MRDANQRSTILAALTMLYAGSFLRLPRGYNPPDADDRVINPPQSEESKQFYIKRAEAKWLRKKEKRLLIS